MPEYQTLGKKAEAEFVQQRSRFIGQAMPVTEEAEALAFINSIKSRHWNAAHNVYAYLLRTGNMQRYSDDGEPQGTAGIPVLEVMRKEGLTDCVVVVTRYFGGILLGAGGLVRAYAHSCKIAIDASGLVTMCLCTHLQIVCDYSFYGKLSLLILECGGKVLQSDFGEHVIVVFAVREDLAPAFEKKLTDSSNGRYSAKIVGKSYTPMEP